MHLSSSVSVQQWNRIIKLKNSEFAFDVSRRLIILEFQVEICLENEDPSAAVRHRRRRRPGGSPPRSRMRRPHPTEGEVAVGESVCHRTRKGRLRQGSLEGVRSTFQRS